MKTKPSKKAIQEYNTGTEETKQALKNIYGSKAFASKQPKMNKKSADLTETIKTFDDVLKQTKESRYSFQKRTKGFNTHHLAYEKLMMITALFNGKSVLDYGNEDQAKYYPWLIWDKDRSGFVFAYASYYSTSAGAGLGPRLCFFERKHAEYCGRQFESIYNAMLVGK